MNKFTFDHLENSSMLVRLPYDLLLRTINPNAEFPRLATVNRGYQGQGFLTAFVKTPLREFAQNQHTSSNWFNRNVVSRLTYALLIPACIITRVADAIIAAVAIPLSLITGGAFGSLNNLAARTSEAPALIFDLVYCVLKIINPHAIG